ncbi:MAG TPA: hypothetical protein VJJ72_02720, partial [Candidatus Paceibacterota bacterium]
SVGTSVPVRLASRSGGMTATRSSSASSRLSGIGTLWSWARVSRGPFVLILKLLILFWILGESAGAYGFRRPNSRRASRIVL